MIETSQERGNRLLAEHQHARSIRVDHSAPVHDEFCRCRRCKPPHGPADVPLLNRIGNGLARRWKAYLALTRAPLTDEDRTELSVW